MNKNIDAEKKHWMEPTSRRMRFALIAYNRPNRGEAPPNWLRDN